ncbi:MAG: zinc finger domain-containing protein, partial [Nanoarchaeota archaeon]|nr:zinc finger domain-containing protein [Nanoarchaeota archaeon]
MKKLTCSSCSKEITNDKGSTNFLCPNCGKHQIVRCL